MLVVSGVMVAKKSTAKNIVFLCGFIKITIGVRSFNSVQDYLIVGNWHSSLPFVVECSVSAESHL